MTTTEIKTAIPPEFLKTLASLTPDDIRARLAELKAEQDALAVLLRAAMARARALNDANPPPRRRPQEVPCGSTAGSSGP